MKSLSTILTEQPLAMLQSIAQWWGAEEPMQASLEARQQLERSMRDTIASRFVWERLGESERRVLFAVVGPSARNWCLFEMIPERARLEPEEARRALASLLEKCLVFSEMAKVQGGDLIGQRATFYGYTLPRNPQAEVEEKLIAYVPTELATALYTTGREQFVPIADRSDKSLDELLMPYRQGDLDQIGRRFGLTLQAYYSRNEVRTAIAENLSQAEAVRYALTQIDPRLRDLYEWLRRQPGGRARTSSIRDFMHIDGADLAAVLHSMEEYALAFDTFSEGERILFIPKETLANLNNSDERPAAEVGLQEQKDPPGAVQPPDTTFLWDLAVMASVAHQHEIELTRSGSLPKRAALRVVPLLVGSRARQSEEEALAYVELLKQEAVEMGLVVAPASTSKARNHLGPGPKLESWGRHDLVMQARRLFRRWPTDRWWMDQPGASYQEWMTFYVEMPVAREVVQKLLRDCRPGVWYSLSSFRTTLHGDNPYVLRPSQRYAGEAGFKLAGDLRRQWEFTDGEIITGMFRSTLFELGIVSLGYHRESVPGENENINPDAFMLTELGREVLNSDLSASQQPSPRALVVQPNFQVLLMEPYMPALYWLVRFGVLEQIGRVSRFTLTREALGRGLKQGATIDEAIDFLEQHSQKALPQNVVYTLRDWARQYKEAVQAAPVPRLIEAPSEALAGELVSSPKLRAFRLHRVGPKVVAVPPETSLRDLWHTLEHLGYATVLGGLEDFVSVATTSLKPSRRRRSMAAVKGA